MSNTFTFRDALLDDLPIICTFPKNATELFYMFPKAQFPLRFEQLKLNFEQRSNSTVFLDGDKVIAYANFYDIEPGRKCTLGNVIIHPMYRGKGVSTFLLEVMQRLAIDQYNATEFHLLCFNTNTPGLLLYTRSGFMPYLMEKRVDFEGKYVLAVHMKKRL
jgi:ribosomal protein S18 acetylase RimI-like enzyme